MRTWRDAALHLFLQEKDRSIAQRRSKHKVAILAAAAARKESAQQKEVSNLVRDLIQVVQELEGPRLDKRLSAETSIFLHQEPLPVEYSDGETKLEAQTYPRAEASSQGAVGGQSLPQPDLLSLDDDWLDQENFAHVEESWLLDTRIESSSKVEDAPEGRDKKRCREVGKQEVVDQDVLLEAAGVGPDGRLAEEEPRLHASAIASGSNGTQQLLESARSAIVAYRKSGGGGLQELRTVGNALEKLKVIRLAELWLLSRRVSELQARVLQWRKSRATKKDMEATAAGARIQSPEGEASCGTGYPVSAPGAAFMTEDFGDAEKEGSPGWLSLDQIDELRRRVLRLEVVLGATCQEMSGRLGALWDQLRVPPKRRAAFEAEQKGPNTLARYDCLEQQLVQAQAQVKLLQPVILLCQQRDDLGRQLESQAATCREASKHLLSRKADGASALRLAEAERKRLLRQQSTVQKQIGEAIGEWEKSTGGRIGADLVGPWKDEHGLEGMQKEAVGCVGRRKGSGFTKKGSVTVTRSEHACASVGKETVLAPVPANIV
ncbi:hypothetical protein KFL_003230210 [Klebsormidium nitens]|uniref:Uncharacterized protein n=1 Tax=Klebsormidium nitens TaxID=105231 RepID=A0A1Y1IE49_KLENI|nr:hypothetical protein KFL_003230210 [Klebsormidium nitens]|eukprot:GAQ86976.1 hypothetical protein KFL_003230210 [Klebsormidium nitens]